MAPRSPRPGGKTAINGFFNEGQRGLNGPRHPGIAALAEYDDAAGVPARALQQRERLDGQLTLTVLGVPEGERERNRK